MHWRCVGVPRENQVLARLRRLIEYGVVHGLRVATRSYGLARTSPLG